MLQLAHEVVHLGIKVSDGVILMSNSRIEAALEARNKRKRSNEEELRSAKEKIDTRIGAALSDRRERLLESLPSTFSEIANQL